MCTHLLSCVLMSSLVCSTSTRLARGKVLTSRVDSNCSMGVVDRKKLLSTYSTYMFVMKGDKSLAYCWS